MNPDDMTLAELFEDIDAELSDGAADVLVCGEVVVDSREVRPGSLFVAMAGALADGHDYLDVAASRGAAAVVVERGRAVPVGVPHVIVDDPRAALGAIASTYYGWPSHSLDVVGVTGTNGKTTTTYMLESICARASLSPGVVGTVSYRWPGHSEPAANTTPGAERLQSLLAQMRDAGCDVALLEVSSHGLETHRLDGARVQVGVYTNFTQDHLDFHGSMEAYRDAKARLFLELLPDAARALNGAPVAVLNADDQECVRLAEILERSHPEVEVWTYSNGRDGRWSARDVVSTLDGVSFRVERLGQHDLALSLPMLGDYNVSNALAAACAASAVGVADEDIQAGLSSMLPVPGRLERAGSSPAVFVDYAHTPDALERSLETLREVTDGALHVVFGCGGDRDREKRPIMGRAAEVGADVVWVTSDNPRGEPPVSILKQILAGMEDAEAAHVEVAREDAILGAILAAAPEDVVLIAGKGHETYQEVAGTRRPFDDREHARDALASRGGRGVTDSSRALGALELSEIARLAGGELVCGDGEASVDRLEIDSRRAGPGALFVALAGERFDANDFVEAVAAAGATAAIASRRELADLAWPDGFGLVLVDDTLAALQALGRGVWDRLDAAGARTVSLTGSNGKTTTKEILRALWGARGETWATRGNYNNHVGVPLTLCAAPKGIETLVVEMGANQPGDIGELIELAPGDLRIITSIGHAHIEGFGGLDGVRRTKGELLDGATARTTAIVPSHERGALVPAGFPGRIVTFGLDAAEGDGAHVRAEVLGASGSGLSVRLTLSGGGYGDAVIVIESPLHGAHNATNLAAACATLWVEGALGSGDEVTRALGALALPGGRWREVDTGRHVFLDDAYNANPSSVLASFEAFMGWRPTREIEGGGRAVVLGEMLELGEGAKSWHEEIAGCISEHSELTTLIAVGEYAEEMAAAARTRGHDGIIVHAARDVSEAAAALDGTSPSVVFLKASRGARLEHVIEQVQDGPAPPGED